MPRDLEQPREPNAELTPEERGKIIGAIESGASQRQAALVTKCSRGAVQQVLKELSSNTLYSNGSARVDGKWYPGVHNNADLK